MKRFAYLSLPSMACVIAVTLTLFNNRAHAERLLDESFEVADSNGDPVGWQTAGHPSYLRVRNESEGDWTTPYGEGALQTYSSGIGTKTIGFMPDDFAPGQGSGDYTIEFNISSFSSMGEYRAELWVNDPVTGWIEVGFAVGDTNGSKDFSFSDQITWRYEHDDWLQFGFSTIAGAELQLKLRQDPNRSNWRNTPLWDNVTVDYVPDVDSAGPTLVDISDDNQGGTVVATGSLVTYTVTFNEPMDATTVITDDFGNAGSADVTINSVTPTSDDAVFLVGVTPTSGGTLRLEIVEDMDLKDAVGNLMDTSSTVLQDNVTFTVEADTPILQPIDIVDDRGGSSAAENTLVTYTLTFSKDMNDSTVQVEDFGNAGTAQITIGTITETTAGVFTVQVTPTDSGTLQFRVNPGVDIRAADGGVLNTSSGIADDTTIIVDSVLPTLTDITDDAGGSAVSVGTLLTYDVFFSEDMGASSVDASDFGNAVTTGNATFTIDSVEEASPGVFRVEVTTTGTGDIQLQINSDADLSDAIGNALDTTSAMLDDTTITVSAPPSNPYDTWAGGATFGDDANGDEVVNGMAWLLGAPNTTIDATDLLPATSRNGGNLRLTFRCLKTANRGGTQLKVQFSNDLGQTDLWGDHEADVPDTDSTVNGVIFDTTEDGDYIDVIADIPASSGKIFARIVGVAP